jgi:hypothetical protein
MNSALPLLAVAVGLTMVIAISALYLRKSNEGIQMARLRMVATTHFLANTIALRPFQRAWIQTPEGQKDYEINYDNVLFQPENVKEHILWPSVLCIATVFITAFTLFMAFEYGYYHTPSMILGGAFQAGSTSISCVAGQPCSDPVQLAIDRYQLDALRTMQFAFLSAYLWALWQLFQRMVTRDVTVYAFHAITVRVMTAAILSLIFFQAFSPAAGAGQVDAFKNVLPNEAGAMPDFDFFILLAFAIGFFPDTALTWLGAQARKRIFNMGAPSSYLDIEEIEGIDTFTRARLAEIGILDAPRLAAANPLTLSLRTPYTLQQIIDWIGQAQLLLLLRDKNFDSLRQHGIRTSFQFYRLLNTDPLPDFLSEFKSGSCQLLLESDPAFVRANEIAEKMIDDPWQAR